MTDKTLKGYTAEDLAAIESPELTDEELAQFRPFTEVFPDLAESIKRGRGRPRKADAKVSVSLRVDPGTVRRFQRLGPDWRGAMAAALKDAVDRTKSG